MFTLALFLTLTVAGASPAAARPLRVSVEAGAPDRGEVGLSFATVDLPRALTGAERRVLARRLQLRRAARDRVVVAAVTSRRNGRRLDIVAVSFLRAKTRSPGAFVNADVALPGRAAVPSTPGPIWVGSPPAAGGRGTTHAMPGCDRLPAIWRTRPRPVLLTSGDGLTPPPANLEDGTRLVTGDGLGARILDQAVGSFCRRGFHSAWLRGLAGAD
jgi:hypothetical protein